MDNPPIARPFIRIISFKNIYYIEGSKDYIIRKENDNVFTIFAFRKLISIRFKLESAVEVMGNRYLLDQKRGALRSLIS